MVYSPGHFQDVHAPRSRGRSERIAVRIFALLAIAVIGVTIYSLTNHQRKTTHGCVDFDYTTMIGGAEMYKCGTEAKALCLTPRSRESLDANFQASLVAACRKAGLPVGKLASAGSGDSLSP
jgi:predicted carbohydrate-binding protein with CBM5 and CBM33 domain